MIEFIFGIATGIAIAKKVEFVKKIKLPKFRVVVKFDDKYAIGKGWFFLPLYRLKKQRFFVD